MGNFIPIITEMLIITKKAATITTAWDIMEESF